MRVARELYGRPTVGVTGYVEAALTSVVGGALLYGLTRRDQSVRNFTALLVGVGCLYQALTMLSVLSNAAALTLLPSSFARIAIAAALGVGAGVLVVTLSEKFGDDAVEPAPAARHATVEGAA